MHDHDEQDPKKLRPVRVPKKGTNRFEAAEAAPWTATRNDAEAAPWSATRKDIDRDRHRHV
jgi:hypothetical protein